MRVLMLTDLYEPFVGGLERHVQTLSRGLVARGHEVTVVTMSHGGLARLETDPYGVAIVRLDGWSRALKRFYEDPLRCFHPPAPDPGTVRQLARVMRDISPEIVNSHSWMVYSYLPMAARYRAKLVHTLHDYRLVCPKQTFLHHGVLCSGSGVWKCLRCAPEQYGVTKGVAVTSALAASAHLHSRVDRYVAVSSAVAAASLPGTHQGSTKIEVIPTFVPDTGVKDGREMPRPAFLPRADGFILFVGALTRDKGIRVLLDAYRRMRSPASLVLLGARRADTPTEVPPGVILRGDVPHPEVMASWSHAAVGVLPSVAPEGLPHAAIEAMVSGKPLVASDTGGISELVIHGETGLLVRPGDAAQLAEALEVLLADRPRLAVMGTKAKAHARHFVLSAVIERVERLFQDVASQ